MLDIKELINNYTQIIALKQKTKLTATENNAFNEMLTKFTAFKKEPSTELALNIIHLFFNNNTHYGHHYINLLQEQNSPKLTKLLQICNQLYTKNNLTDNLLKQVLEHKTPNFLFDLLSYFSTRRQDLQKNENVASLISYHSPRLLLRILQQLPFKLQTQENFDDIIQHKNPEGALSAILATANEKKVSTHIFVGAGPANLHRALKIISMDPDAQIIILDKRLKPESTELMDRDASRANIFRFENNVVTQQLIKEGVDEQELKKLTFDRDFSVAQGFQYGDDTVFSSNKFTQIQIRDLQILLLNTLAKRSKNITLVPEEIDVTTFESIRTDVKKLMDRKTDRVITSSASQHIQVHAATGALHDEKKDVKPDKKQDSIIYPDKIHHQIATATADLTALTVTPEHGTATFFIKNSNGEIVSCDSLKNDQRSLDLTKWKDALAKHGWNLIRPPRVRVFYTNDVLYIGAEIPASMAKLEKKEFEKAITDYTQTIGMLVFPNCHIDSLKVNPHLRLHFKTERGERGQVLNINHQQEDNLEVFYHGDSRYLPHYQTGSGFVTAFLINELYAQIYQSKSFHELYEFAKHNGHLGEHPISEKSIRNSYQAINNTVTTLSSEQKLLQAFQAELYTTCSRDIIETNKVKVGKYLNALHGQSLNSLEADFTNLLSLYNHHHSTPLTAESFGKMSKRVAAVELLRYGNIEFLRALMPKLLNMDFSTIDNTQLLRARDMHVLDYDNILHKEYLEAKANSPLIDTVNLIDTNAIHTSSLPSFFAHQKSDKSKALELAIQQFNNHQAEYSHELLLQSFEKILLVACKKRLFWGAESNQLTLSTTSAEELINFISKPECSALRMRLGIMPTPSSKADDLTERVTAHINTLIEKINIQGNLKSFKEQLLALQEEQQNECTERGSKKQRS